MSARPPERHTGQLTLEGLVPGLAARGCARPGGHTSSCALSRRLYAGNAEVAADLGRALRWRACCDHHALTYGADPAQLPAGDSQC